MTRPKTVGCDTFGIVTANRSPATRTLAADECAFLQQASPVTGQFRASRIIDSPINIDGK